MSAAIRSSAVGPSGRARPGCRVAVLAGEEYESTPSLEQKNTAKALLADPDIHLVYGHHAHVVQPMENINGRWAIYGLGNNIAAQLGSAPGVCWCECGHGGGVGD